MSSAADCPGVYYEDAPSNIAYKQLTLRQLVQLHGTNNKLNCYGAGTTQCPE